MTMLRFPASLFVLLIALLISACQQEPDITDEWAAMPKEHQPALWKVSRNGRYGYLFGGVHALPDGLQWYDNAVPGSLQDSATLVLEIDARQEDQPIPDTFRDMGYTPGLPKVPDRISAQLHDEYEEIAEEADLPDNAFTAQESWATALSLAGLATTGLGVSKDNGVEAILTAEARERNLPIVALESAEEQFSYFDNLSEKHQTLMLEAVIADADEAKESYRELLAHWLTGDVAALAETAQSGMLATGPVREALLVARNRAWTEPIAELIDSNKRPFVAVGAAHVAGEDSVQAMLAEQGFTVERLQ
ncbi:TraB/GumN family protein [Alterisphingorhabdus coralli]|uniref:TraB/GumN family protein n=1 Tax=Alterisphingorhabdus coralli TaxID=3071408 RepID=A0AA97I2I1_9SPHN|nr:TraB/GumN family protein [Parasphingorhabdus sp. SCSIO 66989]WOE76425.1 TraB/GumN family protein [Parasphingorhabdus sp. SCSIO 66989]